MTWTPMPSYWLDLATDVARCPHCGMAVDDDFLCDVQFFPSAWLELDKERYCTSHDHTCSNTYICDCCGKVIAATWNYSSVLLAVCRSSADLAYLEWRKTGREVPFHG